MVLQAEGVVVAVGRGQSDEGFQGEGQTLAVQQPQGRQVKVVQVAEAAEGVGAQERL